MILFLSFYHIQVDDDSFVNVSELRRHLRLWEHDTFGFKKVMYGYLHHAKPIRLTTIFSGVKKWVVPRWLHPKDMFPPYLSGAGNGFFQFLAKLSSLYVFQVCLPHVRGTLYVLHGLGDPTAIFGGCFHNGNPGLKVWNHKASRRADPANIPGPVHPK